MVPFNVGQYKPTLVAYNEGRVRGESETASMGAGSSTSNHFLLASLSACSAIYVKSANGQ